MPDALPITNLQQLLCSLEPLLQPGTYVYATLPHGTDLSCCSPIAIIREAEGMTVVVDADIAQRLGWPVLFCAAWITLQVHSDLQAVGLTAAIATALAQAGLSCNVVAGAFHDHLFVPVKDAQAAMRVLHALQHRAQDAEAAP